MPVRGSPAPAIHIVIRCGAICLASLAGCIPNDWLTSVVLSIADKAREFDRDDRPVEAADAYEAAIATGEADVSIYVDLAVLYFEMQDFGYESFHGYTREMSERSWTRFHEVIEAAEARFGQQAEIVFWRLYQAWLYEGGPWIQVNWERLAETGESLVPYMIEVDKHPNESRKLFDSVKERKTARERYIYSILVGQFGADVG